MGSERINGVQAAPPGRAATASPGLRIEGGVRLSGAPPLALQQLGRAGVLGSYVLDLQRSAGNAAVAGLIHSVQRSPGCGCGTCAGCSANAREDEPLVASRQPDAGAPPACQPPGTRRAGSDVDSVDQAMLAKCEPEAYAILNGHAMFGLLPLLESLRARASFAQIRSSAAVMGGPRMATAIAAVDLKGRGGTITGPDLRPLIDQMGTLPPDQRRDILRYLGKLVVITVQGIDLDFSYCAGAAGGGCVAAVKAEMDSAIKMRSEYAKCRGKKGIKHANDVENCVHASLAKQGFTTTVAGSTSSSGTVTVAANPMSQCQPIIDRGTEIHEAVHAKTQARLQKKFGAGTPAFDAAWDAADGWIQDEIDAYSAEIPFYKAVLKAIAKLEKML